MNTSQIKQPLRERLYPIEKPAPKPEPEWVRRMREGQLRAKALEA